MLFLNVKQLKAFIYGFTFAVVVLIATFGVLFATNKATLAEIGALIADTPPPAEEEEQHEIIIIIYGETVIDTKYKER